MHHFATWDIMFCCSYFLILVPFDFQNSLISDLDCNDVHKQFLLTANGEENVDQSFELFAWS